MKMILDERGKKYVLKPGHDFQSDLGIVKAEVLDSAKVGDEVKSHLDHTFKIMKPNINDFIDIMDRRCSILIQKDIGQVLAHTGLGYGSRVVDAQKNIDNFGITNIEVKNKDIKEGIDEDNIDLVFLDLPKPFEIFEEVLESLNVGGWLCVYAPYIDQAEISYRISKKLGFYDIEIFETLERGLEVRQQGVRPKTRMVGHSGYLVFARKL